MSNVKTDFHSAETREQISQNGKDPIPRREVLANYIGSSETVQSSLAHRTKIAQLSIPENREQAPADEV